MKTYTRLCFILSVLKITAFFERTPLLQTASLSNECPRLIKKSFDERHILT